MAKRSLESLPPPPGGKEELRATVLRPYFSRLRAERGEAACRTLVATVGLPESVLDDDSAWISAAAACRALGALGTALGERAIAERGEWATHPESLSTYVRMLRVASSLPDAYQFLCAHAGESTRLGRFELERAGPNRARVSYVPRTDSDSEQSDACLCELRRGELSALPRLWGLSDATLEESSCLAKGDPSCTYWVSWPAIGNPRGVPVAAVSVGAVCGTAVALSGSFVAAGIASAVGAALGAAVGHLQNRIAGERAARVLERHRIAALERGLEAHGAFGAMPGDLIGVVLGGKYRIKQKIGSGGIGSVYAAEHVALGSNVAIKVLRGAAAADAAEVARLRREARVQVFVEHPNVVQTLDLDQLPDGSIYVVMELLHGMTLGHWTKTAGLLAPDEAVSTFSQVCNALDAAHRHGIVHRDLKPGNIFLCDDGVVKVLDFGMSKLAEAESLTQQGFTLGTPEYMSPEQCSGAPLDGRSDLYSLGVVMYEALTGSLPFSGQDRREILQMHLRTLPMPMIERRPSLGIPRALDQIVLECLAKSPERRPADARALGDLLQSVLPPGSERPRRA